MACDTIHMKTHQAWLAAAMCEPAQLVKSLLATLDMSICKFTRADALSRGRAITLAGMYNHAGNRWGMPCTLRQS